MREQPLQNDSNNGRSHIQEENAKPVQTTKNVHEESVFRQDNTPYSPKGSKEGRIKSHINEEGNLTPADKNGSATVSDHVRGSEPMKSKSPYASFSEEGPGIGKTYGDNVIEVDIKRLEADIAAGKISEVEVLRPDKVQAELQTKIDQAMKRFNENPTPKNQKRVDDAVRDLNNSVRDKEILIKGEIPSEYFKVKPTKSDIFENISSQNESNISKSVNGFVKDNNGNSLIQDRNNINSNFNNRDYSLQQRNPLAFREGLEGVEKASPELIDAISKKRDVNIAKKGTDDYAYLEWMDAEANVGGENMKHILLKDNPSKAAILEEFLHGTQKDIGIINGSPDIPYAEYHVKDFMVRHKKLLGLIDEDVKILEQLRDRDFQIWQNSIDK